LCSQHTRFVRRAGEIAKVKQWLNETVLLTLTRPGGVGKTRLRCRLPHRCYQRFPVACGLFYWLLSGWRTGARRGGLGDLHAIRRYGHRGGSGRSAARRPTNADRHGHPRAPDQRLRHAGSEVGANVSRWLPAASG
jgi:hypothetical protein